MSSKWTKEEIMKKLSIIGIAVLGLTLTIAVSEAGANPGLSKSEARALMLRSERLNQQYGPDVQVRSENPFARRATTQSADVQVRSENPFARGATTQAGYRALVIRSEGLNQKYGIGAVRGENARSLPVSVPTTLASAPSTSTEFQWDYAIIGAGALLVLMAIVAGLFGLGRHRVRLGTS
jgi:hypothetical protein